MFVLCYKYRQNTYIGYPDPKIDLVMWVTHLQCAYVTVLICIEPYMVYRVTKINIYRKDKAHHCCRQTHHIYLVTWWELCTPIAHTQEVADLLWKSKQLERIEGSGQSHFVRCLLHEGRDHFDDGRKAAWLVSLERAVSGNCVPNSLTIKSDNPTFARTHLCKNMFERSLMPVLTCAGNFEARVFGYMNGESVSTSSRSSGSWPSSSNFRTPESDLS